VTTQVISPKVNDLLAQMSLAEKIGQMTQVELGSITPDAVASFAIGSVLSGGGGNPGDGTATAWRDGVEGYIAGSRRSRLGIPVIYGTDAVHGHNNVLDATIFPHNIGMGAAHDPALMRRSARAAALETAATGARWAFAPCLAVPQDIRWGRTYEGFSEQTELVAALGRAAVEGWHGDDLATNGVLACAKHYVGEGAMKWGTAGMHRLPWVDWWDGWGENWQIDQGDAPITEDELRRRHLPPFEAAISAGVLSVMACYGSWNDVRCHDHEYLLTDVLKGELGFEGFVVSDWMAIDQIDADFATCVQRSISAGIDMVMVPFDYERFISTATSLVEAGRLASARIDDAVARILRVKDRLGLLDPPAEPRVNHISLDLVGCDAHRALARSAAGASAVALVDNDALPIRHDASVLGAGVALDDVGISCGGWTITWDGGVGATTTGKTIADGLRSGIGSSGSFRYDAKAQFATGSDRADYGVVTVHELPYVEGAGDCDDLSVPVEQLELVQRVRAVVDTLILVVVSGRPLLIEPLVEVADAIVAAWLPGSEADGISQALLGVIPFTGRLPVTWPRSVTQIGGGSASADEPEAWPVGHRAVTATTPSANPAE